MIRILLVADVVLFREALATALSSEADLTVVGAVAAADGAVPFTQAMRTDVVIVDLDARRIDGDLLGKLCADLPNCSVIALTTIANREVLRRAIESQVRGFITKDSGLEQLVDTIRRVADGERVIEPASAVVAMLASGSPLTPRESHVLRLAADCLPVAEMAEKLCLSSGTVRNYLSVIVRKVGARNRLEAIRIAERSGWL